MRSVAHNFCSSNFHQRLPCMSTICKVRCQGLLHCQSGSNWHLRRKMSPLGNEDAWVSGGVEVIPNSYRWISPLCTALLLKSESFSRQMCWIVMIPWLSPASLDWCRLTNDTRVSTVQGVVIPKGKVSYFTANSWHLNWHFSYTFDRVCKRISTKQRCGQIIVGVILFI